MVILVRRVSFLSVPKWRQPSTDNGSLTSHHRSHHHGTTKHPMLPLPLPPPFLTPIPTTNRSRHH